MVNRKTNFGWKSENQSYAGCKLRVNIFVVLKSQVVRDKMRLKI